LQDHEGKPAEKPGLDIPPIIGEAVQSIISVGYLLFFAKLMTPSTVENSPPSLLKALALLVDSPANINEEAKSWIQCASLMVEREQDNGSPDELVDKIISIYANHVGFSGGALSLMGTIPGLRRSVYLYGGLTSDIALLIKYQVDMTMAIACIYGHPIRTPEIQQQCQLVAGGAVLDRMFPNDKESENATCGTQSSISTAGGLNSLYGRLEDFFDNRFSGSSEYALFNIGLLRKELALQVGAAAKHFFRSSRGTSTIRLQAA